MDPLERSERITALLKQTARSIRQSVLHRAIKSYLISHVDRINTHANLGYVDRIPKECAALTDTLLDEMNRKEVGKLGTEVAPRIGAIVLAIRTFDHELAVEKDEIFEVFLVVCLWCLGDALKS